MASTSTSVAAQVAGVTTTSVPTNVGSVEVSEIAEPAAKPSSLTTLSVDDGGEAQAPLELDAAWRFTITQQLLAIVALGIILGLIGLAALAWSGD